MYHLPNRQEVTEQIQSAFADVVRPTDIVISGHGTEGEEIAEQLEMKGWRDIGRQDLLPNWDMLTLLTPQGFHYYLPAFLLNALKYDTEEYVDVVAEWTLLELLPPAPDAAFYDRFQQRVSLLSQQQRHSVATFVSFWHHLSPDMFPHPSEQTAARMLLFWQSLSLQPVSSNQ